MRCRFGIYFTLWLLVAPFAQAAEPPKSEEDLRREAAIAAFTQRMKDANYPALFDQAAAEFKVPADILKGISFAETRWEHLTWPPGETASPETGMPRPYGIMSLWDNQYFGHSLIQAATLIGKDPEELKADPLQNIRGAAALLRKIYDESEKPPGAAEGDLEAWRYAIRKYCGIPEPDLNAQHALDVYIFISRGYHQYGIEWPEHPVNVEMIQEETRKIVAEERVRRNALVAAGSNTVTPLAATNAATPSNARKRTPERSTSFAPSQAVSAPVSSQPAVRPRWPWVLSGIVILLAVIITYWIRGNRTR